ncbi:GNAT family N-acetyltransferase [Aeromicrobium phragmitis]|uniref:GNAT family N-acetyltransferase n=1 Tax=Aeromicrobium phragmitis TaxID=2478914 RepID=A0A3L8PSL9_9ACTN|nr:GNAT family N-acetyltransferase [Aeromicrobium phragmitis]RLV56982.1 GNAT family N-acetyltransferase [Aeromicrobium phragmitis]
MTEVAAAATYVRSLSRHDLPELVALLDRDPLTNLFVRHRVDATRMDQRWLGAQIWGYFEGGTLTSACHVGANVVPVEATPAAIEAFAHRLAHRDAQSRSIVGPSHVVRPLWERLRPHWGPARSERLEQPFLVIDEDSAVPADDRVRPVAIDEIDALYPASVAMFTEEVGIDPTVGDRGGYRARVTQLVSEGCSFAIFENDEVVFKTEVGASTAAACQLQGVWVDPRYRGRGISASALSAVVFLVRRAFAPTVTLYVNDFNVPARRLYETVGFRQVDTFATILM